MNQLKDNWKRTHEKPHVNRLNTNNAQKRFFITYFANATVLFAFGHQCWHQRLPTAASKVTSSITQSADHWFKGLIFCLLSWPGMWQLGDLLTGVFSYIRWLLGLGFSWGLFTLCDLQLRFFFVYNGLYRSCWGCHSHIVWTLPLNPVQPISCDKRNRSSDQGKSHSVSGPLESIEHDYRISSSSVVKMQFVMFTRQLPKDRACWSSLKSCIRHWTA